jgi:hypothetical protein
MSRTVADRHKELCSEWGEQALETNNVPLWRDARQFNPHQCLAPGAPFRSGSLSTSVRINGAGQHGRSLVPARETYRYDRHIRAQQ